MVHPLLNNKRLFFTWLGIWIFIMIIQFLTLAFSVGFDIGFSIADSIFSVITYIFISLGLWYTVRFRLQQLKNPLNIIFNNLLLYLATTVLWIIIVWGLLTFVSIEYAIIYKQTILSYRIVASLMFYITTVVVYYAIGFYETLQEKQAQELQLKTLVREAQLNELRSQLHPHFLFNSLNSISSLTLTNPEQAGDMIIKLSEFLRYSLSRKGHSMATFEKELYHVKQYLEIEKIRFGKRLEFIEATERASGDWPIPLMLLQPLIENAVKHGVYNTSQTVTIRLKAETKGNYLIIRIHNNFDPDAVPVRGTGTGLNNVKERLRLVYGRSDLMKTISENNSYLVEVQIPYFKDNIKQHDNTNQSTDYR